VKTFRKLTEALNFDTLLCIPNLAFVSLLPYVALHVFDVPGRW
jgi:hypothetical protein